MLLSLCNNAEYILKTTAKLYYIKVPTFHFIIIIIIVYE